MIAPHGGTLINRIVDGHEREALLAQGNELPRIEVDAWTLSDIEMIGIGGFSPLQGFMTRKDYDRVVADRRLANGLVWTIPVTLAVSAAQTKGLKGDVALTNGGQVVAILHLEEAWAPDKSVEAQQVFKTTDASHPGVARLQAIGDTYVGGRISVINRPKAAAFLPYRLDPADTRRIFAERGWKRVSWRFRPATRFTGRTSTFRSARWKSAMDCCCTPSLAKRRAMTSPRRCG